MNRKPSFYNENRQKLEKLVKDLGLEYEFMDPREFQMRIYGATHVIDIWPSRMTFHRVSGETIRSTEKYARGELGLDTDPTSSSRYRIDISKAINLLETGEV